MESTKVKEWTVRIANATPGQLVVITYEMLIESIDNMIQCIKEKKVDEFYQISKSAQKIMSQLTDNLDMQYEISLELMALYLHINKNIAQAAIKFNVEPLQEAKELLNILLVGWDKATEQLKQKAVMQNSEKVYAGLTYGKGTLNESVVNDPNRGLKA